MGALKSAPTIRALVDRGLDPLAQREIQDLQATLTMGQEAGLADSQKQKASMDVQLQSQNYDGWSRAVTEFTGNLCVSSTGLINPNRDLDGNELQVLHQHAPLEALLFGMAATNEGGAVVFTWPEKLVAPHAFVTSLLKRKKYLPGLLVQFVFSFIENTFFSERWWQSLTDTERRHLTELAGIANAYYDPFEFISSKMVPWEITKVVLE